MKKITKILPLVLFPSLIMVACNKTANTNQDAVNNVNGITEFKVTVDLNGGKVGESSEFQFSVRDGTYYEYFKTNLPTAGQIQRPGYTFSHYSIPGLYSDAQIPDTHRFRENTTIVAQYAPQGEPRTITWKNYDDTQLAQETYYDGETPSYKGATPEHAKEPGKTYTFAGWDPAIAVVSADATYKATFTPTVDECVVSFDTKGGSAIAPILVNNGGTIANAPANPTKEGYVFKQEAGHSGWFYVKDSQTYEFTFGTTTVTSDMTLYCEWNKASINATFVPNGGTWSGASGTGDKTVPTDFGDIPTLDEDISFTGHTFAGWKRTSDEGIGLVPMTAAGETYTAQWDVAPAVKHNVTFHFNNGSASVTEDTEVISVAEGDPINRPKWVPTYEGHTFDDWYDAQTGGAKYFATEHTMGAADVNIFAYWTETPAPATYHVVSFNSQGGSFVPGIQVESGKAPTEAQKPADPTLEHKVFGGWYKDSACTVGQEFTFGDSGTVVSDDMTVYAKWSDETPITANFSYLNNTTGVTAPNMLFVYKGASSSESLESGAAKDIEFKRSYLYFNFLKTSSEPDLDKNRVTITINSVDVANDKYDITDVGGGEYNITLHSDVEIPASASVVFTVHDAPAETCTLTVDFNNGTAPTTITGLVVGQPVPVEKRPATPQLTGKTFYDWFNTNTYGIFDFDANIVGDTEIKAHWKVQLDIVYLNTLVPTTESKWNYFALGDTERQYLGVNQTHSDKEFDIDGGGGGRSISFVLNYNQEGTSEPEAGWAFDEDPYNNIDVVYMDEDGNTTTLLKQDFVFNPSTTFPSVSFNLTTYGYEKISTGGSLTLTIHAYNP